MYNSFHFLYTSILLFIIWFLKLCIWLYVIFEAFYAIIYDIPSFFFFLWISIYAFENLYIQQMSWFLMSTNDYLLLWASPILYFLRLASALLLLLFKGYRLCRRPLLNQVLVFVIWNCLCSWRKRAVCVFNAFCVSGSGRLWMDFVAIWRLSWISVCLGRF